MSISDTTNALESVLGASFSQLVMLILLIGGLLALSLVWVFNRAIRNQGASTAADDNVINALIVNIGSAIKDSSTAVQNNTKAMESLRDTQTQTLKTANEIKTDTATIRHDSDQTQARLIEIKTQLDVMGIELSVVRTGVNSIIEGTPNA